MCYRAPIWLARARPCSYMGLLLHRMNKNYTIMVSAGAVVPTFAPENMTILFRQRVRSWDLCAQRKFMTCAAAAASLCDLTGRAGAAIRHMQTRMRRVSGRAGT